MSALLALFNAVPALAWRWIAILAVAAAAGVACYMKGVEHEAVKFEAYKAEVKALGDKQNALTQRTIALHIQMKENASDEANRLRLERDRAVSDAGRMRNAAASRSFVPARPANARGPTRICYPTDELDQRVRQATGKLRSRAISLAQVGQNGIDIAHVCHDYAVALSKTTATPPMRSWSVDAGDYATGSKALAVSTSRPK